MNNIWLWCVLGVCVITMVYVMLNYVAIKRMPEGTDRMIKMSKIIRDGSNVFIKKEFTTIAIIVAGIAVLFSLFIEKWSGVTYLLGAIMSSIVCILGMKSATFANVRTANTARETKNVGETVKTALKGGSISGLSVQAFGLIGILLIVIISGVGPQTVETLTGSGLGNLDAFEGNGLINIKALLTNASIMRITTYSLGCSTVAMFNRVAGGNYTKAADISADILGKIRNDLPEDDARVPNVIADFIGDNVNDIAGNCSDLLESFVATISATIVIAVSLLTSKTDGGNFVITSEELFKATYMYPLVVAGGGLLSCVLGITIVSVRKMGDNPSKELNLATYISAGLTLVVIGVVSYVAFADKDISNLGWKLGWATPWVCAILGLASGVAIGMITEYYTSADYKPTRTVAEYATEGEAFVVTKGDAVGSRSCLYPILIIGGSLVVSGLISGTYGIAVAALGMLSFVGTTVSIDAFGPIADNAGGLAESCHLDPDVRVITDKLDSVGNTTAAIGKGFAIGSAAFATVSLICAYVGNFDKMPQIDSFMVIAGCIIGGALIEFFCALLTDNTIAAAKELADVGDKQLSDPAILAGEKDPDYNELVALATKSALKRMVAPSVIALAVPFVCGSILGPEFVVGVLLGATICAIPRAIFMGNSGGSFDNAKKYIEAGNIEGHGKGTAAHKAAVTGDTIGDTRKDVVGVALDIFIKMMSTVATTLFVVINAIYMLIQSLF